MRILKAIGSVIGSFRQKEEHATCELVDEMQTCFDVPHTEELPKMADYSKISRELLALGSFRKYVKRKPLLSTKENQHLYCAGYEAGRTEIYSEETISRALAAYLFTMNEARRKPGGALLLDEVRAIRHVVKTIAFNEEP